MKTFKFTKLALAVAISGAMVGGTAIAQDDERDYDLQNMKTEQNENNVSGNQGVYSTESDAQETQREETYSQQADESAAQQQWNETEAEAEAEEQSDWADTSENEDSLAMDSEDQKVIHFEFDSAELTEEGRQKLQELAQSLEGEEAKVKIHGYTDTSGPEEYNQHLAEQRAKAVEEFLQSEGLDAERLETEARGEENPIASNDDRQGRIQNRRVEVSVEGAS